MKPRDGRLRQTPKSYVEGGCSICLAYHMLVDALCSFRDTLCHVCSQISREEAAAFVLCIICLSTLCILCATCLCHVCSQISREVA